VAYILTGSAIDLRNRIVLPEATETIRCATLAATTLLGLIPFTAFSWWWAGPSPH
jgi:hypothetical protein